MVKKKINLGEKKKKKVELCSKPESFLEGITAALRHVQA